MGTIPRYWDGARWNHPQHAKLYDAFGWAERAAKKAQAETLVPCGVVGLPDRNPITGEVVVEQ